MDLSQRRRRFLGAAVVVALGGPLWALAETVRFRRVGVLTPAPVQWRPLAFRQGLRDLGYVEGTNVVLDIRSADGKLERMPGLAEALLRAGVDVIVGVNTPGARAAIQATATVPIVMAAVGDPVGLGFVTNLARPGGNVTGVANMAGDIATKRLQLLREVLPEAMRIALLLHPDEPIVAPQLESLDAAGAPLGVQFRRFPVRTAADAERAVREAAAWRAHALLRLAGQAATMAPTVGALALKYRLPLMPLLTTDVEPGGLLAYFPDHDELFRRVAYYVDRILRGTPPRDLPIEQPTKFEFAVNLRTARTLGIRIPPSLLLRADHVVE